MISDLFKPKKSISDAYAPGGFFNPNKNVTDKFSAPRPQKAITPETPATKATGGTSTQTIGGTKTGSTKTTTTSPWAQKPQAGSMASTYNKNANPSIANLYNSALQYGSGGVTDPSRYTQASERLARDTNQALADAALSPDQTKSFFEGRTGMIQDLASKRAANLSSVMGENRAQQELGLKGVGQAFEMAKPQTISPTDMAYSPLQGINEINQANQASGFGRVARAGQLGAIQGLGGQTVENQARQQKLNESQQFLSGLFGNYTNLGLVPLNEWKNKIKALGSSGQIASVVTALNAVAEQMPEGSQKQELLKGLQGDLSNMSPSTIQKALETASAQIGTQNTAIQNVINQGQNTGLGSWNDSL